MLPVAIIKEPKFLVVCYVGYVFRCLLRPVSLLIIFHVTSVCTEMWFTMARTDNISPCNRSMSLTIASCDRTRTISLFPIGTARFAHHCGGKVIRDL